MNVIYSVKDYVTNVFDFHQATASGAIDIVAVQHESGAVRCTPFHVHFGRVELQNKADKTVTLVVNGAVVPDVHMKLGAAGEAFFVDSVESPVDDDYSTSPLVSPSAASALLAAPSSRSSVKTPPATVLSPTSAREKTRTISSARDAQPEQQQQNAEPAEWHDAYRLVSDPRLPALHREASAPSERLTWGWGALPIVRAASVADLSVLAEEAQADEETHTMVKSDSVYFDAVEAENLQTGSYVSDHPCMSLCGHLLEQAQTREQAHAIFSDHIITFESFKENAASFLQNPDLRFLVDGKICPFNMDIQAYLVSRVLFPSSQPLPLTCSWTASARQQSRRPSERLETSFWFGDLDEEDEEDEEDDQDGLGQENGASRPRRWFQWFPRSSSTGSSSSSSSAFQPVEIAPTKPPATAQQNSIPPVFFRKTLQPSQEQLARMGLRHGTNDIEFVVATAAGSERVSAKLYLWSVSSKIIIAEIDGAISRAPSGSGRRLSALLTTNKDKDSAGPHQGALEFYARAARNGYRIVYLTSRGLSQADLIHQMLRGSSGNRDQLLPNGPVLLSPDRLLESDAEDTTCVTREFKFAALNGLRTLFPEDVNPFYAAFGKTYADSVVFTQVGVFPGKVFLVDEGDGRLRHRSMMNYQESYSSLLGLVDKMFPPICSPSPRHPTRRDSSALGDTDASTSSSLTSSSMSLPTTPRSAAVPIRSPQASMKRVLSATEEFVSDVLSSHVRTRSMGDEAYNDVNFWRIKPGSIP